MVYFNKDYKGAYCMKNWKHFIFLAIIAIFGIVIAFTACDDGNKPCSHNWEWKVTTPATLEADGLETEICSICNETRGTRPIPKLELELVDKTYTITLKDDALEFVVEYKALETDEEPAYLAYLEERLVAMVASTGPANQDAIIGLLTKGNSFKIKVEYDDFYMGLVWNTTKQAFTVHNDWISIASGTSGDNALTLTMMREAFNSVEIE